MNRNLWNSVNIFRNNNITKIFIILCIFSTSNNKLHSYQQINALAIQVLDEIDSSSLQSRGRIETLGNDDFLKQQQQQLSFQNYNPSIFETIYQWRLLDFEYPTYQRRQKAIFNGEFNPESNLPLGIEITKDRIFLTTPRWKDGVPASLNWLPYPANELSPPLKPYPNWEEHGDPYNPDCTKLISVYRLHIDECNRLWAIDSGIINATVKLNPVCPPKIVAFDLKLNYRILTYELPPDQVKEDSLHSNIIVDVRRGKCNNAHVYVTDVWRFGIVVFSLEKQRSWRVTNHHFNPNPSASDFNLYGLNFQWLDGVFGMSLSPLTNRNDRILFFHPMASYKEFMVSTAVIQNESLWINGGVGTAQSFVPIGDRGLKGQSSASGIDRNQVMFYSLVHRDEIGCWDIKKPYTRGNLGVIAQNITEIMFPNDLKLDKEYNQNVWVVSNRLPIFLYSKLNTSEINFYILRANTQVATEGTICDPKIPAHVSVTPDFEECY